MAVAFVKDGFRAPSPAFLPPPPPSVFLHLARKRLALEAWLRLPLGALG